MIDWVGRNQVIHMYIFTYIYVYIHTYIHVNIYVYIHMRTYVLLFWQPSIVAFFGGQYTVPFYGLHFQIQSCSNF